MAKCPDLHPLVTIPIQDIVATFRVTLDLPTYENKNATKQSHKIENSKELHQFEIFNRNGDYPYNEEFIQSLEDKDVQNINKVNVDDYEGFRLWSQHEELRRTHRHTVNKTRKGWLMRSPVAVKSPRSPNGESIVYSARSFLPGSTTSQSSTFRFPKEADNKLSTARTMKSRDGYVVEDTRPVYKWNKEKADLISWSGREKEWYFSEKRLLFATPNEEEREKWVSVLNWINNESQLH